MQLRYNTKLVYYYARKAGWQRGHPSGIGYGAYTDEEYFALWHVYYAEQPAGGRGDKRSTGRINAATVSTGNNTTVDTWFTLDHHPWTTGTEQWIDLPLPMGWSDFDYGSWPNESDHSLMATAIRPTVFHEGGNRPFIGRGWGFPIHIGPRGGLQLTTEEDEIAQSIFIILRTMPGERVLRPTFGCGLYELLFASMNTETLALARRYVEEALAMWEPRIVITNILVEQGEDEQDGCLFITLQYEIKTTRDRRSLVYPFYLIPEE